MAVGRAAAGSVGAVDRRSTALRISAATTIDRATTVQISHCRTSSLTVFSTVWKMLRTVDRTSRTNDPLVVMTNVLSEKVSRENAESRSSLDSIEKNRMNSANVTMPMVTFALFILFFSIESKDERDSAFSLDTFSDKTFVITTSGSFVLLILSTVLSIFQTVMKTVRLDVPQWLICTAVALSIVVAAEIRKEVLRRTAVKASHPAPAGAM